MIETWKPIAADSEFQPLPAAKDEGTLVSILEQYGLDVGMYGTAGEKTTKQLLMEIAGGESRLAVSPHLLAESAEINDNAFQTSFTSEHEILRSHNIF